MPRICMNSLNPRVKVRRMAKMVINWNFEQVSGELNLGVFNDFK